MTSQIKKKIVHIIAWRIYYILKRATFTHLLALLSTALAMQRTFDTHSSKEWTTSNVQKCWKFENVENQLCSFKMFGLSLDTAHAFNPHTKKSLSVKSTHSTSRRDGHHRLYLTGTIYTVNPNTFLKVNFHPLGQSEMYLGNKQF